MTDQPDTRVAVYLDFDNIVISRYDQVHGRGAFQRVKNYPVQSDRPDPAGDAATVDVGAIMDFASSFGTVVLSRAYADWSVPVNAAYRGQLVSRAVDLVQLFPAAAYGKNGADIRLAVDAVEDMFRLPDLTHVVIVAGDSDYIALAQRCRRLGRYIVGVGVAGSTSRSLGAACDEMTNYDALPGVEPVPAPSGDGGDGGDGGDRKRATAKKAVKKTAAKKTAGRRGGGAAAGAQADDTAVPDAHPETDEDQQAATRLLERALRLVHEKSESDWLHSSAVKQQMRRMDSSFREKSLGYKSFSDFVKSRSDVAEIDESSSAHLVRLTGS
ncbi:MAG: hypothetical protein CSA58_03695 [Micrococcales bacterium]|nr:MAG: hypothetical protein CSB46_05935 [Micrococcales bacterium]PIE27528.1 MAG: hypothetical protein CSA58_03695 [Micrococcales bacterium]